MEKIIVNLTGVRLVIVEDKSSVELTFAEAIKGFKKDSDGNYVDAEVFTVSIPRSKFIAQLCDVCDDIAFYRASLDHSFTQKDLGLILFRAKLEIERSLHAAGELVVDYKGNPVMKDGQQLTLTRDCYFTDIKSVILSKKSMELLDKAIML